MDNSKLEAMLFCAWIQKIILSGKKYQKRNQLHKNVKFENPQYYFRSVAILSFLIDSYPNNPLSIYHTRQSLRNLYLINWLRDVVFTSFIAKRYFLIFAVAIVKLKISIKVYKLTYIIWTEEPNQNGKKMRRELHKLENLYLIMAGTIKIRLEIGKENEREEVKKTNVRS